MMYVEAEKKVKKERKKGISEVSMSQHVEWDLNKTSKTLTQTLIALILMV